MITYLDFVRLCKDAETFLIEIKKKNPSAIKLQGIKPSTLKATAIHYLARKRGMNVTLCDLYQIYGKFQQAIIRTEKIIKKLDEKPMHSWEKEITK